MKSRYLLRVICLLALFGSFIPAGKANALVLTDVPPADMFQLPWEHGFSWVALDGFDNGSDRSPGSPHNYLNGGAIDFAPHNNMRKGENTSNFWVTAAANGMIVEISKCHMKIAHANGWVTEYQHLANIQVKLGDVVTRDQKLAIIANASTRQPVCPGSEPPDIPHLHFVLRPNMVGATFAGWEFRYSSFWNTTAFKRNGVTVGLFKPLLNASIEQSTSTPTIPATTTSVPDTTSPAPSSTPVESPSTATPTLFGQYVSTMVNPAIINNGETAEVTVNLNNVPQEGYTSAEFTCFYDQSLLAVSNIAVTDLFGTDAVTAINEAQYNRFIVAIAGSHGNKAATSGAVFTFSVRGLRVIQTQVGCEAHVSKGDNALTPISSAPASITIVGSTTSTPTPNLTPSTSTVLPSTCDRAEFVADINIPPGTVLSPGSAFTKTWRLKNLGPCEWTASNYQLVFFYGEHMGAPFSLALPASVSAGETVDISLQMTAPNAPGSYRGYWMFRNSTGMNFGIGPDANQPWFVDINVSGPTLPPSPTLAPPSNSPTATLGLPANTPTLTITPGNPTTTPAVNWSTFTNLKYNFQFAYPSDSQIAAGNTDNDTRINLPFASGTNFQTNLQEKYVQFIVEENQNPCVVSPMVGGSSTQPENVTVNNIQFSALTGSEVAAGNRYDWVSYATTRDNACISLAFILHSVDPGNYQTPPPVFDKASESTVFAQIMSTYTWLASPVTITPTLSPTSSPTGMFTGQVIASKPVTISVYGADNNLVVSVQASLNNSFGVTLSGGTYTVVASASGFLNTQGSFSVTSNLNSTLPTITLNAGDIDNNNVIDQFDALTLGMSYNASTPAAADLNDDGIINVLDLELLAQYYRKTGPVVWQ